MGVPEAALVQVGEETAAGYVVGVRDVVAAHHALAGDLTSPGHDAPRQVSCCRPWPGRRRPRRVAGDAPRRAGTRILTGGRQEVGFRPGPGRWIGRARPEKRREG